MRMLGVDCGSLADAFVDLTLAFLTSFSYACPEIGDYFGILMDARVTSFPFSVNDDPMYNGTALMSLGTALWYRTGHGSR